MRKILAAAFLFLFTQNSPLFAEKGTAVLHSTTGDSEIIGRAVLEDTPEGLKIQAEISKGTPGKHGFHIHQFGDCGDAGKAAGGHYNPDGVPHGFLPKDGFAHAHAGDLGNIEIGEDATGKLEITVPEVTLGGGKYSVGGRSLVFHEKTDDFGQPTGNAGGRAGCGTILLTENQVPAA